VGAGLLRDRFDHVFHTSDEVKSEVNLPVLGHIPHVDFFQGVREDKRFLLSELDSSVTSTGAEAESRDKSYQRFFYQEAFRNLFTSLRFLNSDHPLKTIALTSSLPAEGKSLVNVLLAKTLSEMGQRVLLIDADLRKPQLHIRLGLNNLKGLSNLLAEDNQRWQDVLIKVPGYDSWSVLIAGRRPPDPTRLLSSNRMHQLVQDLAESNDFDLIIFDTPPVLGLADAALVAEHCDGLMLLVGLGRVDRRLPKEAINRILSSRVPLLGVITNAIKKEPQSSSNRYGKYGYWKYGYGYDDTYQAYAHYAISEAEDTTPPQSDQEANNRSWRQSLTSNSSRFIRWLDR
jgi:capsular exopolysaccharide synthesis family protein